MHRSFSKAGNASNTLKGVVLRRLYEDDDRRDVNPQHAD
jgi:hypothetical protein